MATSHFPVFTVQPDFIALPNNRRNGDAANFAVRAESSDCEMPIRNDGASKSACMIRTLIRSVGEPGS
jgi:hypothetical protein